MATCPSCRREHPGAFSFCPFCGATLLSQASRAEARERRVVTSLFCDLVGFTAMAESADPEDVDAMLVAYFEVARARIDGHGGVVQKFIGDAVVGVFGLPSAHEDDPERAVRAGLRIVEDAERLVAVDGLPLRLRVGVNTGEAFVRLDVMPDAGEAFLTGDATNTASRIQSVAPPMGVAVGLATYEATARVFDYEELEAAAVKGKADRVRVFHARAPLARLGVDLTRTHDTPFVGREAELALLKQAFDATVEESASRLVTVVGEPGLGKSRLLAELMADVDRSPGLVIWRQGRCLPYGEGITFWALGEIIKAHAGILESDPLGVATSKLDAVLPEGNERAWFRQRLLPLLGVEANSSAGRGELFTAWRRFLEHIAEDRPTVLVFEDLHWADEAMLAFLEHLAELAESVPLFVVGTARPELFERHPDYGGGLPTVTPIRLAPLSADETARLVSALLETTVIPAELQQSILERAGGNPLFAEEFVRLLKDRDLLVRRGLSWELRGGAEVPSPASVQALMAARLDLLPSETKSILADAAVVGKVFWAGALAQMGKRDPASVTEILRQLSHQEFVRAARWSSIEGESEYMFWHVLTRDVAYGQLPRASRATRHIAAAAWIESKAPDRVEDVADVLAHHYSTALELARASGQLEQASDLEAPALRFLALAGERALGLDAAAAVGSFERALALTPADHPGRPRALACFGVAAQQTGRLAEAAEALEEAIAAFRASGDLGAASRAMATLSAVLSRVGDPRWSELPAEALALLEPLPPSPELVDALTELSRAETLTGRSESGLHCADRALMLAEELGLDRSARALGYRGLARADRGDIGGLEDMREAIMLAIDAGQGHEAAGLHVNLSASLFSFEGPPSCLPVLRAGVAFAEARGLAGVVDALKALGLEVLGDAGEHEEALTLATEIAERLVALGDVSALINVRALEVRIFAMRGHGERAAEVLEWLETAARGVGNPRLLVRGLESAALVRAGQRQMEAAAALLSEVEATVGDAHDLSLTDNVRTALVVGDMEIAERFVLAFEPRTPYDDHNLAAANAALAEARGDLQDASVAYADAADRCARFGMVPEQAFALLGQGRCVLRLSGPDDAAPVLRRAYELFDHLQAVPALAEIATLRQQAATA